ncbi:glucosamine-6-phosphate deaminase [Aminithiophilus ramosus]|uniref:Glucosamine-6-phosphate deaminase n=1 Tax=Aminithiophilus ramosus TaxID=3029084 RepID=A0A9Q7ACG0_9BACT|nr:glucosamine-6-phosphate deaminase [Aminithiophilus ramosus]QTX32358.1 glucosamine-6-phosphate deaminase [Aminithiophilus ramosus]
MRVVTARDYDQMSRKASYIVASRVILNPKCVLGLATGDTPKGLYRELAFLFRAGDVDFSGVTTFNLDEYVGLAPDHPNSYQSYMREHFFRFVNVSPGRRHIPDGTVPDLAAECRRYEAAIERAGGIDLQILGLGRDGHIGFNEPDVKFETGTHVVTLAESTLEANARFFAHAGDVPRSAISMGIRTIMSARRILLLAAGAEKAEAIRGAVLGAVTPDLPASVLQLHPNVTVIVDEAAARTL